MGNKDRMENEMENELKDGMKFCMLRSLIKKSGITPNNVVDKVYRAKKAKVEGMVVQVKLPSAKGTKEVAKGKRVNNRFLFLKCCLQAMLADINNASGAKPAKGGFANLLKKVFKGGGENEKLRKSVEGLLGKLNNTLKQNSGNYKQLDAIYIKSMDCILKAHNTLGAQFEKVDKRDGGLVDAKVSLLCVDYKYLMKLYKCLERLRGKGVFKERIIQRYTKDVTWSGLSSLFIKGGKGEKISKVDSEDTSEGHGDNDVSDQDSENEGQEDSDDFGAVNRKASKRKSGKRSEIKFNTDTENDGVSDDDAEEDSDSLSIRDAKKRKSAKLPESSDGPVLKERSNKKSKGDKREAKTGDRELLSESDGGSVDSDGDGKDGFSAEPEVANAGANTSDVEVQAPPDKKRSRLEVPDISKKVKVSPELKQSLENLKNLIDKLNDNDKNEFRKEFTKLSGLINGNTLEINHLK